MTARRVLVAGWFSVLHGEATAGDLEAGAAVGRWLDRAGVDWQTAWSPAFCRHPTLEELSPADFSDLVWVCGPAAGAPVLELLERFSGCRRILLGASAVDGSVTSRFDVVWARDGVGGGLPDLSLAVPHEPWPLVAVVRANPQPEYGAALHDDAHRAVDAALAGCPVTVLDVDTRVEPRSSRRRSSAQVARLLGAADAAVSTRLHGLVLGLRAGVPVLAVDPVPGGAKVTAQARTLGWPAILPAGGLSPGSVTEQLRWCLSADARRRVAEVTAAATDRLERLGAEVAAALAG